MASNPNNLNMGMRCIKYMLIVINLMFMLTSVLLITVGTTIGAIYTEFSDFLDDHFLSPPVLLVAIGAIMLVVATFGCFGAFKESTMLINIYGLLLAVVFILEISAAFAAFALQGQVEAMLTRTMHDSLRSYTTQPDIESAVDFMQSQLECCGVNEPADWSGILNNSTDVYDTDSIILPGSCCADYPRTSESCEQHFSYGCFNRMNFIISQSAMLIATGATTVAFVQILGVICAFMLAKTIRRTKSLRAARRWQLHQSLGVLANEKPSYEAYTQLEKAELSEKKSVEPVTYMASSPSVN